MVPEATKFNYCLQKFEYMYISTADRTMQRIMELNLIKNLQLTIIKQQPTSFMF